MEHAVSEHLIDRIDAYLGHPTVDPHGDPIPRADGTLPEPPAGPLAELPGRGRFRVTRVVDQDPRFLRYLSECGLDLGAEGAVIENRRESGAAGRPRRRPPGGAGQRGGGQGARGRRSRTDPRTEGSSR